MKLGIMQPYLFPYIGYFQLIHAVDAFLIYDDVNFIKQGWINRNRILMNGVPMYFTLGLKGASSFKKICEIEINDNRDKLLKTVAQAYKKAPYFDDVFPLVKQVLETDELNLGRFVTGSIKAVAGFLGIATPIEVSSEKRLFPELSGHERVLAICAHYGATDYVNAIGGKELYSREEFARNGTRLHFLRTAAFAYPQVASDFVPNLSIIDVLMHNPLDAVKEYLRRFSLE